MGNTISKSSFSRTTEMPNSRNIYDKTQATVDLMNRILDFILRNADIRDMISLANADECSKWIVIAEKQISTVFDRIQMQPELGNDGIFYVKKAETLKKNKYDNACKLLALFFIRLFQVVGALSLSVMDTKIPEKDYLITAKAAEEYKERGVPFFKKLEEKPKSWFGFGGELSGNDITSLEESLKIFAPYLTKTTTLDAGGNILYQLTTIREPKKTASIQPGFTLKIIKNKIIFEHERYISGNNEILIFELSLKSPKFVSNLTRININLLKRKEKDYPYNKDFIYAKQDSNKILVSIEDKPAEDFIEFIKKITNEMHDLPNSTTMNFLSKFSYLEESRYSKQYFKIKGINFGTENEGIFVSKKDINKENPTFLFGFATKINSTNVDAEITFNMLISENPDGKTYSVLIDNLENKTDAKKLNFTPNLNFEREQYANTDEIEKETVTNSNAKANFTVKNGITKTSDEPTYGNKNLPKWLEGKFKIIQKQALQVIEFGIKSSEKGYINPVDDSQVDSSVYKTSELWRVLLRDPPVKAFCTARGLQLLNTLGLQKVITSDKTIQPLIFNTAFDLIKDKSLPSPGQNIIDAYSIKALITLYEDTSDFTKSNSKSKSTGLFSRFIDSPLSSTKVDTKDNKEASIGKLIAAFRNVEYNTITEKTLSALKKTQEQTGNPVSPLTMSKDSAKINELRNKAIELFSIQFEHTKKVNVLLNKLFTIDNSITLNNDILSKGIRGIEEVAVEARDLLSDYYSNCQIKYNEGVKIIQKPAVAPATK